MVRRSLQTFGLFFFVFVANCSGTVATSLAATHAASVVSLPEAVASFGAIADGNTLYVYGCHLGRTHVHSAENVSGQFHCVNLVDETEWTKLPSGPKLQGAMLAAHAGVIYRVGGMVAENATDEEEFIYSTNAAAAFDPAVGTWSGLPDLPAGRSSHDVASVAGKLYVVGGWDLQRDGSVDWATEVLFLDLSADNRQWHSLRQPFECRALAAVAFGNQLYVIGGMTPDDVISRQVHIFHPESNTWSNGPPLPGNVMNGFGPAACVCGGRLYVGCLDGEIYRLNERLNRWESVWSLAIPRYLHRLLPVDDRSLLALGGESRGGHVRLNETVPCLFDVGVQVSTWQIANPSEVKHSQSASLYRGDVWVFGGSNVNQQHSLDPSDLTDSAFQVSLGTLSAKPFPKPPFKTQLMKSIVVSGMEYEPLTVSLGGIADQSIQRDSLDVLSYQFEERKWYNSTVSIPQRRWLFQLARRRSTVWMFGGFQLGTNSDKYAFPASVLTLDVSDETPEFRETSIDMPTPRFGFDGAQLNGKYYLVGGFETHGKLAASSDVFDFDTGQWSKIPPPPRSRIWPQLVAFKGKLYLAGGKSLSDVGELAENRALVEFNPATGQWLQVVEKLPVNTSSMHLFSLPHRLLCYSIEPKHGYAFQLCTIYPVADSERTD